MSSPRSPDAGARAELLAELRWLERAARPLEPGAPRRKRHRAAAKA
ncbi:MAG: hypothetical protein ACTHM9_14660 [Gemmatimonadales bacterium]